MLFTSAGGLISGSLDFHSNAVGWDGVLPPPAAGLPSAVVVVPAALLPPQPAKPAMKMESTMNR
jgi:hypothetical protein